MKGLFSNLKEKNTFIFFIMLFGIFMIAFDPNHSVDKVFLSNFDKFKHVLAFLVISYFFVESSIKLKLVLKVFILILLAFFIEYIQSLVGREANIMDFFASLLGVVIFFVVRYFIYKEE